MSAVRPFRSEFVDLRRGPRRTISTGTGVTIASHWLASRWAYRFGWFRGDDWRGLRADSPNPHCLWEFRGVLSRGLLPLHLGKEPRAVARTPFLGPTYMGTLHITLAPEVRQSHRFSTMVCIKAALRAPAVARQQRKVKFGTQLAEQALDFMQHPDNASHWSELCQD